MKKLVLILAAVILVSLALVFCVSADGAWDGTPATKFAGGNGTEGNAYQISNAAEWAYFSEFAPKNPGKYYKLTADITFNEGDATTWGEEFDGIDMTPYIVGSWYTPDGDPVVGDAGVDKAPFIGTFDGDGHTISGFYAKKANGDGDTVAIFGSTAYGATATIKNLLITNSYFEAAEGVAAACVGQAEGGTTTIKNVYVTDTVKVVADNKYAGGIMAHLGQGKFDVPSVVIDSCVNAATVVATSKNGVSVAGILGNGNQKIVTITNCLNMGDISAYRYVGGILGFGKVDSSKNPDSSVTIQYCVNTGKITAEYSSNNNGKACSIVCFDGTERDVQKAEYCYYVAGTGSYGVFEGKGEGDGATPVAVFDLCESVLLPDLDSEMWIARGNDSETPKTYDICIPKGVENFAPSPTKYFTVYDVPDWLANYETTTEFEIDSVEKFKEFANFVNGKYTESGNFAGKIVKLAANLNFNEGDASTWGETAPENDMTEYMIGSWSSPFCGTFDGQTYAISGFYAKKYAGEGDTVGLFGSTTYGGTSTIKNLIITNSYFECADGCVAACIAQAHAGTTTIKAVYVTDSVYVVSNGHYAGGIVAHLGQGNFKTEDYGLPQLIIEGCVNAATVTATGNSGASVGGILGNANKKIVTVTDCLNIGNISGYQYVGGIIGYGLGEENAESLSAITLTSCVNVGIIKTTFNGKSDIGKACGITCFGNNKIKSVIVAENCLYASGTAYYGVYHNGEAEGTTMLSAGADLIGLDVSNFLAKKIPNWTKRDGEIMIPTAVAEFAPASSYKGEEIVTEPITDPVTEPGTDPITNKPADETKKPVETKAPETSSGGCGGFTVVATAILVAVAGFSTAIVIKQR